MSKKHSVAIIGGGFCGTMVAVHLLCQTEVPLEIFLINSGFPLSKGLAYSSYSHKHLLNVRAKSMSAFADKPNDFVDWITKHENYRVLDQETLPQMFLPRNIYGYYLKDVFENAIRKKSDKTTINFIHDEAIDIEFKDNLANVYFSVTPSITVNKVILATGNQLPLNPRIKSQAFYSSKNYFVNPWLHEAVNHPDPHKEILIIGNGLTMADVVIGLMEKNYKGKIYSLSTNGFDLVPHRDPRPYTGFAEECVPPYRLETLVKLFRKHLDAGAKSAELVESIRPLIQSIWQAWTYDEKKWFVSHLRHLWEVNRHRLPMQVHEQIQQLIIDNKLEIIAGRILDIQENVDDITVAFRRKRDQKEYKLNVARIINCTGPAMDINTYTNPLFVNLLDRKLIQPHKLKMGIEATPTGQVLNREGEVSSFLYTIGSNLKGVLWESTAVPELRVQAKRLAEEIVRGCFHNPVKSFG